MHPSEAKVSVAIEACLSLLTQEEHREVSDENERYGEWGLAIETLADFLGEKGAKVSAEQLKLIEDAFAVVEIEPGRRTQYLRELMLAK